MDNCYSDFKVNKEHLPEAICIDEFKSVKNIDGAMSFVFADYQSKSIIDIVEDIYMDMYSPFGYSNFGNFKKCILIQIEIISISA